jgi:hypothetical protein
VGSVARVSAPEIEGIVERALRQKLQDHDSPIETAAVHLDRVTVKRNCLEITFTPGDISTGPIAIPWTQSLPNETTVPPTMSDQKLDQKLVQSVVRANAWLKELASGRAPSVEELAVKAQLHPKVIRQGLRLAFLAPEITSTILEGQQPSTIYLAKIPKMLSLNWSEQAKLLSQIPKVLATRSQLSML